MIGSWFYRRLRILGLSLAVLLATVLIFLSIYFYQFLNQNLARAGDSASALATYNLDTNHDFNLVFFKVSNLNDPTALIDDLYLANFKVKENRVNLIFFRDVEDRINFRGVGPIKLSALYGRSKLNDSSDFSAMSRSLSEAVGLPIDGIFYAEPEGFEKVRAALSDAHAGDGRLVKGLAIPLTAIKNLFLLGSGYKTNLTPNSFLNFTRFLLFNAPDSFKIYEIGNLGSDTDRLDLLLRENFINRQIEEERLKIIVLNGTNEPGLAGGAGRIVSNLGLTLLSVSNTQDNRLFENSLLIAKSKNYYSVDRLLTVFGVSDLRLESESQVSDDPQFSRFLRADLVLILGQDMLSP